MRELCIARQVTKNEERPIVVAVNKWDLIKDGEEKRKFQQEIQNRLNEKVNECLMEVPTVFLSAKFHQNLKILLDKCLVIERRSAARIATSKLNGWFQRWS